MRQKEARGTLGFPLFYVDFMLLRDRLLARSGLHAVAGFADIKTDLLALEANASESARSVAVLYNRRIVQRGHRQINNLGGHFGEPVLALHDADFHIGAAAIP